MSDKDDITKHYHSIGTARTAKGMSTMILQSDGEGSSTAIIDKRHSFEKLILVNEPAQLKKENKFLSWLRKRKS